jgi:hypothetical protein
MPEFGNNVWAIAAGYIPFARVADSKAVASGNRISVLNAGEHMANVAMTVYYRDREPGGPYFLTIAPFRVRTVRFNDLIFPEAILLDTQFGVLIEADVPVIVQFGGRFCIQPAMATTTTLAFAEER